VKTYTVWDYLANVDEIYDTPFRVKRGRVVWEYVRLPVDDRDDSGDDAVYIGRAHPDYPLTPIERRVPITTEIELLPA
jgi:hypothetical protein